MSLVGSFGRDSLGEGFGALLRDHRRSVGLTQKKLAELSGLSVRAIRDLERGRVRVPRRDSLDVLVAALGFANLEAVEKAVETARAARSRVGHPAGGAETKEGTSPGGLCELPSDVADFTGRTEELGRLRALAGPGGESGGTVAISAISGQGGIGKTALALHMSHELAGRFPDACLYVDLRGMDEYPVDPGQVLGSFLSALGLPEKFIPEGVEDRAARFRALLFRRRALVVLDNAVDEAQVRPLLPSGPSCLVLVTSRNVLVGLETRHRLLLDVLAPCDAVALLAEIVGERTVAEPEATAEVVALCGYLPLALRIVGNRLASRPGWSMEFLAGRLRDTHARLKELQVGDLRVRAAFAVSYGHASPAARLVFRRLALVPGPDFDAALAAVLAGTEVMRAEMVLGELADASLILTASAPGRYRLHDLVRLFADETFRAEEEDEAARRAVEDRMLDWLLVTTVRAGELFYPSSDDRTTEPAPPVTTNAEAGSWLEAEQANWMGAVRRAAALRRHDAVCAVATALRWYFAACGGVGGDGRELYALALAAARATGDLLSEARHSHLLGIGHARHGRHLEEARECFHQGLATARRAGGDQREEGWLLNSLAWTYAVLGRFTEALDGHERALALFRAGGYRVDEAMTLHNLGATLGRSRRFTEAVDCHRQALAAYREIGYGPGKGIALQALGRTLVAMGRLTEAVDCFEQAVAILGAEGPGWWEGMARCRLGSTLHELGRFAEAADHHQHAVVAFEASGDPYRSAGALRALGTAVRELGDAGRARECWQRALEIYEQLDLPEAGQVRELLG